MNKKHIGFLSNEANIFFSELLSKINVNYKIYTDTINGEYGVMSKTGNFYKYDFVIPDLGICIEYNGDIWHANPSLFKQNEQPNPYNNLTAKEIWKKDKIKIDTLLTERNIKTLVIWSSDNNKLEKALQYIKENDDRNK